VILVDVEVPVMGKTYDVQIDETVPVKEIAGQIRDMICLQEQCGILGGQENLTLWDVQRQQCLMGEHTAKEYEITKQGLRRWKKKNGRIKAYYCPQGMTLRKGAYVDDIEEDAAIVFC